MQIEYPRFGTILVEGETYEHDVVIEAGAVRPRDKGPSKALKRGGHTPLSASEQIPWAGRLVIGSGYSGGLPIALDLREQAEARGVELIVLPTAEACSVLADVDPAAVHAILHVTC